jgi:hypothetical protein
MALWQGFAYTVMQYLAFKMPGGAAEFGQLFVTLALSAFTGMMLGLLASAISPNAASSPLILIMMIVPLIVLSGYVAPIPTKVSAVASTRWTFQGLIGITGIGSDVTRDPCWKLDEDLRDSMDLDQKAQFQCNCMGVQVFDQNSCNFPSLGDFYTEEIDQPAPLKPASLPEQPPEPVIPSAPNPPTNTYDQVQMAQYLNALVSYQDDVKIIQDDYRNQMDLYKAMADVYTSEMTKYQYDLAEYTVARISAVKAAEGIINGYSEKLGWTFVNKKDSERYLHWVVSTWIPQLEIVAVYFVIILFLIKRKDAK